MASDNEKVYKIVESPTCGRELIARRKILAGELIIDEPALLTSPGFARGNDNSQQIHKIGSSSTETIDFTQADASVCLVCCVNITPSSYIRCTLCGLLFCSDQCISQDLHTQNECLIFPKIRPVWNQKDNRTKKSLYNLVVVIRALFYKFRDVTKWTQIKNLNSKSEALEKVGGFVEVQDLLSSLSWNMFVSSSSCSPSAENKNSDNDSIIADENILEAAQHCLGVMRMNAFSSFSESYSREGLFFISSFMSHSCVINTDRQIGLGEMQDVRMVVRASVDIEKGEPITTTYLSLLYSTEERHRIMISSWLFVCHCKRCQDPMEYEAFSGAIVCQRKLISDGSYVCCDDISDCACHRSKDTRMLITNITQKRPRDLYNIADVESWLDSFDTGKLLHPNHSIFAHVKLFLCQFYGRESGGLDELSVSRLKRKVIYCLQNISIFDRVCPGIQMCRGVVMFELWCGLRKLLELKELPLSISYPFKPTCVYPNLQTSTRITEDDVFEIKKKTLEILRYAMPNSPEQSMVDCLLED